MDPPHDSIDGLGLTLEHLSERGVAAALIALQKRILANTEQIMKDASREAGETRESFAQIKEAVSGAIGRLMDKLNQKDAETAALKQQLADANETVLDAAEAAATSDQTQKDMQAEADELAKVGIDVVVPPPVEPVPSDGTEPPPPPAP
jgi:chromosome segregation ATPase